MQRAFLIGNVTKDPEMKPVGDRSLCSFTIAVNSKKKGADVATFYRINAWGGLADTCMKYVGRGSKVAVIGELDITAFINNGGEARPSIDVRADNVEFLSPKKDGAAATSNSRAANTSSGLQTGLGNDDEDEDDLPF